MYEHLHQSYSLCITNSATQYIKHIDIALQMEQLHATNKECTQVQDICHVKDDKIGQQHDSKVIEKYVFDEKIR